VHDRARACREKAGERQFEAVKEGKRR
jgi:hypothetical protein